MRIIDVFTEFPEERSNFDILQGPLNGEGSFQYNSDIEARRVWYQWGLDTPVVSPDNHDC